MSLDVAKEMVKEYVRVGPRRGFGRASKRSFLSRLVLQYHSRSCQEICGEREDSQREAPSGCRDTRLVVEHRGVIPVSW